VFDLVGYVCLCERFSISLKLAKLLRQTVKILANEESVTPLVE